MNLDKKYNTVNNKLNKQLEEYEVFIKDKENKINELYEEKIVFENEKKNILYEKNVVEVFLKIKNIFSNNSLNESKCLLKQKLSEVLSEDITIKHQRQLHEEIHQIKNKIKNSCKHEICVYKITEPSYCSYEDPDWGYRICMLCGLRESGDGDKDREFKILNKTTIKLLFNIRDFYYDREKITEYDKLITSNMDYINNLVFNKRDKNIIKKYLKIDLLNLKK